VALFSLLAGAYVSVARTLPSLELADRIPASETTKIYDSSPTPVLVTELRGLEDRQILTGDEIPQVMRDAVVAIEDPRFYEHKGMDFFAILRAAWANARQRQVDFAGSPITQQLIKNAFLTEEQKTPDITLEPAVAYAVESRWTKEKILNEYLNYVYFGADAYGIQAAARAYFGVDADELTLPQAALLAGLPESPSAYSPLYDPEGALARRDLVLNKMYQQRFISSQRLQEALEAPLGLADASSREKEVEHFYIDLLREQLIARYGSSTVMDGGLRVFTSLNMSMQQAAERAVEDAIAQSEPPRSDSAPTPSVALVALDIHSGGMVAMVSADRSPGAETNLAFQTRRPIGSAFRPFIVAAALDQGISPEATYESGSMTLPLPTGFAIIDSPDDGTLTLAQAVARSSDGVFARLITEVGPTAAAEMASDMGLPVSSATASPALATEGPDEGVTPLRLAMAYATLAAGGERISAAVAFDPSKEGYPVTIAKVTDRDSALIDENSLAQTRVLDRGIAELVTECLEGVVHDGASLVPYIGRPAAGVSARSEDGKDTWFVGYTPELVTAVWVGYPDDQQIEGSPAAEPIPGVSLPGEIWAAFMTAALANTPVSDFPTADAAEWVSVEVCAESHMIPTELCPLIVKRLFRLGEAPTDTCGLHVPKAVFMPDVVGLSLSKAKTLLADATLTVRTINDTSSLKPAGIVTRQDHASDTPVLEGSEITLHVSTGQSVSVPRLTGLTAEEAQGALSAASLAIEVTQQASDTVAVGVVISQSPASGAVVRKGTAVRVTVSSGPATPSSTTPSTSPPTSP